MIYEQLYVGSLNLFNCLRILSSPALRRAKAIYCKEAGACGRAVFPRQIRIIPDHSFVPFSRTNFADSRAAGIFLLAHDRYKHDADRYLGRFLEQAMAASVFDSVVLVMDHQVMSTEMKGVTCIILPLSPFLPDLRDRYRTARREIVWGFGHRRVIRSVRRLLSHGVKIVRAVSSSARTAIQRGTTVTPLAALSVLSFRGGSTWEGRHDLAWLTASTPAHPIIFEYAQPRYDLSETFLAELVARGIRIVETHNRKRRVPGGDAWHPGWTFLVRSARALGVFVRDLCVAFRAPLGLGVWRAVQRLQFQMMFAERTDYYRTFNVKAEFISGFTRAEPAHSGALAACGGISSVAQYSTWTDHFASHTSTSTFHLNFGAAVGSWNLPFLADYSVLNGYLFKTALAGNNPTVSRITQQFQTAAVRRSVCFLDEGFEHEDLAAYTLTFYEYLLRRVVTDPQFGLIIKPKKDDTIDILRGRFADLLAAAEQSGRIIVLDRRHYPGHAARCVDLTVGILGTAPFECAIAGCPAIYFSLYGYVPPFMADIRHNVFGDAPEGIAAIERFFDSPADTAIGAHSERFLQSIDHYRDVETADRIQYLMTTYLSEIRSGRTRDHAIAATVEGFSSRWPLATAESQAVH